MCPLISVVKFTFSEYAKIVIQFLFVCIDTLRPSHFFFLACREGYQYVGFKGIIIRG